MVKVNGASGAPITETFKFVGPQSCILFHVTFLLGFLFGPEDEGDMFLRKPVGFLWTTRRSITENINSSQIPP
jgi:hypothetical protein